MLILQNLSYTHPNKDLLFDDLSLSVGHHEKIALVGNNGSGKSTLLKIIAGELQPAAGQVRPDARPYYIPQLFGQYNHQTIAQTLQIDGKLHALKEILNGHITDEHLDRVGDDWTIEDRSLEALSAWQLDGLNLTQCMGTLSGGQKTKVFLAGISIHQPELVLLDEPSNHLDTAGRQQLYDFIKSTSSTLVVVSHDRKLLNLLDKVCELSKGGITVYGGNYDFYAEQKLVEANALQQDIDSKAKELRMAREKERETLERQQKQNARGKKKQEKAGMARIMINTMRNNAENSTSKLQNVHAEKIGGISKNLQDLRATLPDIDKMKFGFASSVLHRGKVLFTATDINFSYGANPLWRDNLSCQITSGERIALKGLNGSGKTTLIRMILGELTAQAGRVYRADSMAVYVDQDYSLIDNSLDVYEQAQRFNTSAMQEHEIKIRLHRFLFTKAYWDKSCSTLSGGERMRLMLCCLSISSRAPDIIILDEPTNNLDIQNIEILIAAINEYRGTLLVVSHDESFLEQVNVERVINL